MADPTSVDYYEALELSAGASDAEIEAVYPGLCERFHPDNPESGDSRRYKLVMMAYSVLKDPERRPAYDAYYRRSKPTAAAKPEVEARSRPDGGAGDRANDAIAAFAADRVVRTRILATLYESRRRDGPKGIGDYSLEQRIGITTDDMRFHLWYMTAKGWVARTDDGQIGITVAGIDELNTVQ